MATKAQLVKYFFTCSAGHITSRVVTALHARVNCPCGLIARFNGEMSEQQKKGYKCVLCYVNRHADDKGITGTTYQAVVPSETTEGKSYNVAVHVLDLDVRFYCSCPNFWANFHNPSYACKHLTELVEHIKENHESK